MEIASMLLGGGIGMLIGLTLGIMLCHGFCNRCEEERKKK